MLSSLDKNIFCFKESLWIKSHAFWSFKYQEWVKKIKIGRATTEEIKKMKGSSCEKRDLKMRIKRESK